MWCCYGVQVRAEGHPGKDADGPDTLDRTEHFKLTDCWLTVSQTLLLNLKFSHSSIPPSSGHNWNCNHTPSYLLVILFSSLCFSDISSLIFTFVCLFLSTAKCHNSSFLQSDVQYILKHTPSDSLGQISLSEPVCGTVWLHLPDEVGVHEFRSDWSQDLVVTVLHQAQLTSVKDHAHLRRSHKTRLNTCSAAPIHCCLRSMCRHTHIFIFKKELLVASGARPRHLEDRNGKVSDLL